MTAPLDLEAIQRRASAKAERIANAQRVLDAPDDGSRSDLLRKRQAIMFVGVNDTDDHRDCLALIAEVERLTFDLEQQRIDNKRLRNDLTESEMDRQQAEAKLEDQNERIAQLHRERGEAESVAEVGRLKLPA